MNSNDVILRLLDMVIAEKEKNFILQQNMLNTNNAQDEKKNKD